ncbi:MAG: class I SAM-dependent methyltransferase [Thermoplasmatota archaeon]
MRCAGLAVPREEAETTRQRLAEAGSIVVGLKPIRTVDSVVFPIQGSASAGLPEYEFVAFPTRTPWPETLPPELRDEAPGSFDQIGDVLVVKIPPSLEHRAKEVANAMLAGRPGVRTVARDLGVHGELRIRQLEVLAGDPRTETVHLESGMRLHVDPARVYFSPRLGFERERVAAHVRRGETVVDLFAGVGAWSILIAKRAQPAHVYAVDLNPVAVAFLRENVEANRVAGTVAPIEADARAFARDHPATADRVIANLPHGASEFFDDILVLLKRGGVLHYHCIREPDGIDEHLADLERRAAARGRGWELMGQRVVRAYSPTERHFAIDVRLP